MNKTRPPMTKKLSDMSVASSTIGVDQD